MIYREYLVMRKAVGWFAALLAAALILLALWHKGAKGDYAGICITSGGLAAVFASIFGVALGNASREAARVLWVLPAARWKLALQVVAVDLVATTVAFFLAFAGQALSMEMRGTVSSAAIVMALAMAYATYGWSALVGVVGRRVAYCGIIALPALIVWMLLAQKQLPIGTVVRAAILANPFAVFNTAVAVGNWERHGFSLDPVSSSLQWLGTAWETPVLIAIAIVTCGLAVALWQRAQAIY
jgi:hypothetical protein